jgi:hypothetical protein
MRSTGIIILLALAAVLPAQTQPESAPPEVDRALRERAAKFYQAHVDGKYRLAEQVIAEDSKDIYYAAQKPRYLKFEITKITYSDHFTKATVVAKCEREITSKFGVYTLNVPQESYWKLEGGEWCWYVDPDVIRTPFGDTIKRSQLPVNSQPNVGASATRKGPSVEDVLRTMNQSVKVDKSMVRLSAKAPSAEVVISNTMPGAVTLKVQKFDVPGLAVKLDKEQIASKESCRVLFQFTPQAALPATANVIVQVDPAGQAIPIQVQFGAN